MHPLLQAVQSLQTDISQDVTCKVKSVFSDLKIAFFFQDPCNYVKSYIAKQLLKYLK